MFSMPKCVRKLAIVAAAFPLMQMGACSIDQNLVAALTNASNQRVIAGLNAGITNLTRLFTELPPQFQFGFFN